MFFRFIMYIDIKICIVIDIKIRIVDHVLNKMEPTQCDSGIAAVFFNTGIIQTANRIERHFIFIIIIMIIQYLKD